MGKASERIEIAAPIERVFALWTDAERMPEWFPGLESVSGMTAPLSAQGAEYKLQLRGARAECVVTRVEAPTFHEHDFKQSPPPLAGSAVIRFQEEGADATTMTFDVHYEVAGGVLGRAVDFLVLRHFAERRMRSELPRFKAFVEGQVSAGP